MDEVEKLKKQIALIKKKSNVRKRHLRDLNNKMQLLTALADAALSDAIRWKREADLWKLKYETLATSSKN